MEILLVTHPNSLKPLQPQGLFISFIALQDPSSSHQYLAPLQSAQPDNRANEALNAKSKKKPGHTKTILNTFPLTSTLIPSTNSPITSLPVAITDAICPAKLHRNLVPLVRDLIEATIKCKRQLLLSW
jgi:hypothetical protein